MRNRHVHTGFFIEWAQERGLNEPLEIERSVLEPYQRNFFYHSKKKRRAVDVSQSAIERGPLRLWFK